MSSPLVVVWRVTERCNLACGFCAFDRTLQRPRAEVSLDAVAPMLRLLGGLRAQTGREVLVSWLGGEPLLWPHLEAATSLAREHGLRVSLTTNGLAFARERWRRFAVDELAELTVSVDGPAEVHDRFRGQVGQGALLLDVLRKLRDARDSAGSKLQLKVNTILLRESVDAFAAFVDEVADAGADALTFNDLGGADRPEFHAVHHPAAGQIERFVEALPEVQRRAAARGLTLFGDAAYLHRLRCTHRGIPLAIDDCHPGASFWFIDASGRLAPCSFTTDAYAVPIAELGCIDDLLALPERLRALRGATRHLACSDCRSTQVFAKFARPAA